MADDKDLMAVQAGLANLLSGKINTDQLLKSAGVAPPPGPNKPTTTTPDKKKEDKKDNKKDKSEKKEKDKTKKKGLWSKMFSGGDEESSKPAPASEGLISGPTGFKREMHIGFNSETGGFEVRYIYVLLVSPEAYT